MLLRKGFRTSLILEDGSEVVPRASDAMLHDEEGVDWPYCSVLIGPMTRTSQRLDPEIAKSGDLSLSKGLLIAGSVTAVGAILGGLIGRTANGAWLGALAGSVAGGAYALNGASSNALTRYFGSSYPTKLGSAPVESLPRSLSSWREVGRVVTINYQRTGYRAPDYFFHDFKRPVNLYERGQYLRLQLPSGCVVDSHGFVRP